LTATAPLTGVVLLNMGGPDTLSAVRPFLANLFSDRDLIRLPAPFLTQPLFAWLVSGIRSRKVKRYYEEIGGGSPIGKHTEDQRAALEAALLEAGGNFRVYAGMRYWHPLARHAALDMKQDGVARALAISLYPQYCRATAGSSLKDLRHWLRWAGATIPLTEVASYPDHPGYIAALVGSIRQTLVSAGAGEGAHLLFSFHGVPKSLIDEGDPYQKESRRTVAAVMRSFPGHPYSISYQSKVGRAEWLSPDTFDRVRRLGRDGVDTLVVIPASFVSEHIETLHELDIRLRAAAEEAGVRTFLRVPALNDSPAFIRALREIALAALGEPPPDPASPGERESSPGRVA